MREIWQLNEPQMGACLNYLKDRSLRQEHVNVHVEVNVHLVLIENI